MKYSYNVFCPHCNKILGKVEDGIDGINADENIFRCNQCKKFFKLNVKFNKGILMYNSEKVLIEK